MHFVASLFRIITRPMRYVHFLSKDFKVAQQKQTFPYCEISAADVPSKSSFQHTALSPNSRFSSKLMIWLSSMSSNNSGRHYFFIARQHPAADIPILSVRLSVRPSVCLSVTRWYCMKTAQIIVIVFSPYGSPIIPVLRASNIFTKFRRGHPLRGAEYRWGIKIARFSTNKSLYLANDTRYRHSYYGRRIGNRTQAFE